ncbi:MAG: amidohydrolase family protein [Eggerthellaceae bacterium]
MCAQYIFPSPNCFRGAVLVRDNATRHRHDRDAQLRRRSGRFRPGGYHPFDLHTHLENTVMRGIVHDVPYTTWVTSMLEKSAKMDVSDWYDSAILGGLEALSSGITCVADITATGAACTATQKLGMRSVIYREVGAMDKRRVDYAMRIAENDIMHWREEVDGDRITIGVAPAAMYACHPSMFSKVSEFARRENVPVAMHVAGNREEYNFIKYGSSPFSVHTMDQKRGFVEIPPWLPTGTTPVRYALNWGAFESDNVLAIHCVHVDDKDVQKLKEYDVAVAVCPRCNAQLGMGVAPINEFMRAGLRPGLGMTRRPQPTPPTCSPRCIGMLVQRAVNVGEFSSATMLEMATIGGARALKLDDKIGSLDLGKLAVLLAVDLSGSLQTPTTDPVSAVVNTCSGADILMTMVNGTALYEKHKWNVGVEVARNIARIIEIRGKLRL